MFVYGTNVIKGISSVFLQLYALRECLYHTGTTIEARGQAYCKEWRCRVLASLPPVESSLRCSLIMGLAINHLRKPHKTTIRVADSRQPCRLARLRRRGIRPGRMATSS
ncbi:unnamed protein product [Haemonchus placei]|uniref:Secreted protein n=1 Tax=Haemonchus placei TaxID=6290 RepID=A0A0N4X6W0_HAEPC|nr:unnamed protein product [Haemonchus placei]